MGFTDNFDTIFTKIELDIDKLPKNKEMMTEAHHTFSEYMIPYTPMKDGDLSNPNKQVIDEEAVHYPREYAHYQWAGIVYGPNIPIFKDGVIVRWVSPPHKHPTDRPLTYSTEKHQKATHHWNEAMMNEKAEPFLNDITKIVLDTLLKEGGK